MVSIILIYLLQRVPKHLKDRRTRPYDVNSGKETVFGMLKYNGPNIHEYSIPNIHNIGLFTNVSIDDFYKYWGIVDSVSPRDTYLELVIDGNHKNLKDAYPSQKMSSEAIRDEVQESGYSYRNRIWENISGVTSLSLLTLGLVCV